MAAELPPASGAEFSGGTGDAELAAATAGAGLGTGTAGAELTAGTAGAEFAAGTAGAELGGGSAGAALVMAAALAGADAARPWMVGVGDEAAPRVRPADAEGLAGGRAARVGGCEVVGGCERGDATFTSSGSSATTLLVAATGADGLSVGAVGNPATAESRTTSARGRSSRSAGVFVRTMSR